MIQEPELILKQMARCCSRATVVGQERVHISFRVDIENEILCHEPGISAVIFSSS